MKRVLSWLLAWLLVPASALAVPATPYDPALMIRYPLLTEQQQTLFDRLYDAVSRREETVWLPEGTGYHEAVAVAEAMLDDCPELCCLDKNYAVGYYQDEPDTAIYIRFAYVLPQEKQAELLRRAAEMAGAAGGGSWDKALQLEEGLCARVTYDASAPNRDNAYGALAEGAAVCEGYAQAMTLLARLAGIPAGLVTGTAANALGTEPHAWNVLRLNGAWTHVDPTWDDGADRGVTHWYFGLTDDMMRADHAWADAAFPCTETSVSWHSRKGLLLPENETAARAVFAGAVKRMVCEGGNVNLRFADEDMYRDFVENADDWLAAYNAASPQTAFYGAYSLMLSDAQQCVLLCRTE